MRTIADEKGVALITSLFFLVIVTALAAGALMLATVQVQVSGSVARWERTYAAAEACESYVFPLVTSVHFGSGIPPEYANAHPGLNLDRPTGKTQTWSSGDTENLICTAVDNFTAKVDIDILGTTSTGGGSIDTGSFRYHQSSYGGSEMSVYRIRSTAATVADSTSEQATVCQAIYLKLP